MTPEPSDAARERRRNEILAACLEDPLLAAEVASFLADRQRLEHLAAPLRPHRAFHLSGAATVGLPPAEPDPSATAGPAPGAPTRFGAYELLEELGRGGMGVVCKARQPGLNRLVALKMILSGRLAAAEDLLRFRAEAEATARLRHPTIVAVYEAGEVARQHFFSMAYIEGRTLAQRLVEGPVSSRTAAGYVGPIARAVHHAHSHGILHRDLKPSNILLDRDDEPHVTDFGLAKRLGAG